MTDILYPLNRAAESLDYIQECLKPYECAAVLRHIRELTGCASNLRRQKDMAVQCIEQLLIKIDDDSLYCALCDQEHCHECGKTNVGNSYPLMWNWNGRNNHD